MWLRSVDGVGPDAPRALGRLGGGVTRVRGARLHLHVVGPDDDGYKGFDA